MGVNSLPKTVTRLRFEPRPFCARVQHANHSATEPPTRPARRIGLDYSRRGRRDVTAAAVTSLPVRLVADDVGRWRHTDARRRAASCWDTGSGRRGTEVCQWWGLHTHTSTRTHTHTHTPAHTVGPIHLLALLQYNGWLSFAETTVSNFSLRPKVRLET